MWKPRLSLLAVTICTVVVISTVSGEDDQTSEHSQDRRATFSTHPCSGCKTLPERRRRSLHGSWSYGSGPRYTSRSTRTFSTDEIDAFNQGLHRKRPKFIGKRQAVEITTGSEGGHAMPRPELADSGSKPEEEMMAKENAEQLWPVGGDDRKRSPPRKFLGRRSSLVDAGENSGSARPEVADEDVSSALGDADAEFAKRSSSGGSPAPRRKFVGKRTRKFVGRRSQFDNLSRIQNGGPFVDESSSTSDVIDDDQTPTDSVRSKARDFLMEKLLADEMLAAGELDRSVQKSDAKRAGRKFVG